MGRVCRIILIASVFLLFSVSAFAGLADPDGDFAFYKEATFHLKGDYLGYWKRFSDRDINGYNGNDKNADGNRIQTDEIEQWMQHDIRLYPKIFFNEKLEFNMRIDMGGYVFQSDIHNRIATGTDPDDEDDLITVYEDWEKLYLKEANLQMITPIGLFLIGRFDEDKHGLVYAIQLPSLPKWSFAAAWLMKHEGKRQAIENKFWSYPETMNYDYLDRDDQNESAIVSIYDDVVDGEGIRSQQWIEFRIADSRQDLASNTEIYLPQWEFEYWKDKFHFWSYVGYGQGTIAELTQMSAADDLNELMGLGQQLTEELALPLSAPNITIKNITVESSINFGFQMDYRIEKYKPHFTFMYLDGGEAYNEVAGLIWDEHEPQGFRMPRRFNLLMFGEIEDKYYPLLAAIGTQGAFDQGDIAYSNVTMLQAGTTYNVNKKWTLFGQLTGLWRTKTGYYDHDYWDMFPIMYALGNQKGITTVTGEAQTEVPVVLKRNDVNYYTNVDPFLGLEINGYVAYNLFEGLDIRLLVSYFKPGDFYKDVFTPKPYFIQWANQDTKVATADQDSVLGPYQGADAFDLQDAWSIQLQVDFKFEI